MDSYDQHSTLRHLLRHQALENAPWSLPLARHVLHDHGRHGCGRDYGHVRSKIRPPHVRGDAHCPSSIAEPLSHLCLQAMWWTSIGVFLCH